MVILQFILQYIVERVNDSLGACVQNLGEGKGPHMFDISAVLGKEETVTRMRRAVEALK